MKLLLDADFLVGLAKTDDAHHEKCLEMFAKLKHRGAKFFSTNLVIQEVGTVLSHKIGPVAVNSFYKKLPKLGLFLIRVDKMVEDKAWVVMLEQTRKGCSFVDCSNLIIVEENGFDGILSFDKFYPKELRLV